MSSPVRLRSISWSIAIWALLCGGLLRADSKPAISWSVTDPKFAGPPDAPYADLEFRLTNDSSEDLIIKFVQPSCGCTEVKTPTFPWVIGPGKTVTIESRVDLRGKSGELHKKLTIYTNDNTINLPMIVKIPEFDVGADRRRNQMLALRDSRAIFRGDCVKCHVEPTVGKTGGELYRAACAICHEAEHRASLVPDLAVAAAQKSPEDWKTWVTHGRAGTLMPPFAKEHGGILDAEQISSLVDYLAARKWDEASAGAQRTEDSGTEDSVRKTEGR